ncbi:MAG TPA: SurA N-terminal domain-containing protein [Chitinophaga sp.]|uniref:peptidylprolyl isomerase n=1 Tax=Chitinophaga sp. TaxID=1869181 RepID=UPI002DB7AE22|nr:SurA N-terminal domain-containing protein [Chitinophaga sp.]HEU4553126.1 SurA N-terminal domain-containing protein [Chitinophaga sp.]
MSVIQKIRDKYAMVIVIVICLAIVSFLLQDAFFGKNSLFRRSTTVGKVNGKELDISDYQKRIQDAENGARQQMPNNNIDEQTRQYIREQVWNQFLNEQIMQAQYDKLGIDVTEAEVVDQFNGKNPNPIVVQQFTNPQTGQFDRAEMQRALQNIGQDQSGRMRQALHQLEEMITKSQMQQKYVALVKQAVYYPKWLAAEQQQENSQTANVSYVNIPYATIADSTIKVTDGELNNYINAHKSLFKTEEARKVEYVAFDALPSAADSAAALQQLAALKREMDTTSDDDIEGFINSNSEIKYFDGYVSKNALQVPNKDTIASLPIGAVYGPYIDNNYLVLAKMLDRKTMPDSVKVRHILIGTQQGLPDSIARNRIDSIEKAIKGGADFKEMVLKYSDDPGSKNNGGEYDITPATPFVKEFKDFALEGTKGQMKVVKTQFGYHLIEILDQKNFGPAVKVAYLSKPVDVSKETDSKAYAAASEFAGQNRSQQSFEKNIQEKGYNKRLADNIRPMDFVIPGIGQARELVRWAYDSKRGDVSQVFTFENKYVVAVLTGIRKEGIAALDEVRPQVEAEVKKHKKADELIAKLQNPASLDAAAKTSNQPVQKAEGINFGTPFVPSLGFEPKVVGASFNKSWGTAKVSAPIEGTAGVYVLKVDSYQPASQPVQDLNTQRAAYEQNIKSQLDQQLFDVLKKQSDIEDNRGKFF